MSEIKAIEKLRSIWKQLPAPTYSDELLLAEMDTCIKAIEAEIAEAGETTRKKRRAERVYWQNELHKILDAINGQERFWGDCMDYPLPEATVPPSEIAKRMLSERYMLLPVDADGVSIHVGDICEMGGKRFKVRQLDTDGNCWWAIDGLCEFYIAELCHNVKSHTIEDVLRDVWNEALDYAKSDIWRSPDEVFAERADEIRELLGE